MTNWSVVVGLNIQKVKYWHIRPKNEKQLFALNSNDHIRVQTGTVVTNCQMRQWTCMKLYCVLILTSTSCNLVSIHIGGMNQFQRLIVYSINWPTIIVSFHFVSVLFETTVTEGLSTTVTYCNFTLLKTCTEVLKTKQTNKKPLLTVQTVNNVWNRVVWAMKVSSKDMLWIRPQQQFAWDSVLQPLCVEVHIVRNAYQKEGSE